MTDPIADMLTRIRNAVAVKKPEALVPFSNLKFAVATILKREGFIAGLERVERLHSLQAALRLVLKYKKGESVIRSITRVSKPGRRVYYSYRDIPKVLPSLGILILSTSKGLLTHTEARQAKVGGEVICEID